MLSDFAERKKTCFDYKKKNFLKSITPINPYFWLKNEIFFLLLDMVRISLERILNGFAEKKKKPLWL